MKALTNILLIGALTVGGAALADDAMVKITAPADGAMVAMKGVAVTYQVTPGPKGDHVHFYVDGKEVQVLRQLQGTYTVESLQAGAHELCIKIVDKGHTPIGVEKCIKVTAH